MFVFVLLKSLVHTLPGTKNQRQVLGDISAQISARFVCLKTSYSVGELQFEVGDFKGVIGLATRQKLPRLF